MHLLGGRNNPQSTLYISGVFPFHLKADMRQWVSEAQKPGNAMTRQCWPCQLPAVAAFHCRPPPQASSCFLASRTSSASSGHLSLKMPALRSVSSKVVPGMAGISEMVTADHLPPSPA